MLAAVAAIATILRWVATGAPLEGAYLMLKIIGFCYLESFVVVGLFDALHAVDKRLDKKAEEKAKEAMEAKAKQETTEAKKKPPHPWIEWARKRTVQAYTRTERPRRKVVAAIWGGVLFSLVAFAALDSG
jgi:hypothetical protein